MGVAYYARTPDHKTLFYVGRGSYGTWRPELVGNWFEPDHIPYWDDLPKNKAAYYVRRRFNADMLSDDQYAVEGNALVEYDWEGNVVGISRFEEYVDLTSARQVWLISLYMKWWRLQFVLGSVLYRIRQRLELP